MNDVEERLLARTTQNSIPQDGFDCIYLYENGREVGCLNGPQSDPGVIARADHWSRWSATWAWRQALARVWRA